MTALGGLFTAGASGPGEVPSDRVEVDA
jgi:hypothetical protein